MKKSSIMIAFLLSFCAIAGSSTEFKSKNSLATPIFYQGTSSQFPNHQIKFGYCLLGGTLEYQYLSNFRPKTRNSIQKSKYWMVQVGHFVPVTIGTGKETNWFYCIRRGYTFGHLETSIGYTFRIHHYITSSYPMGIPETENKFFPTGHLGFTTLGLRNRFKFNVSLGYPEFLSIGTTVSLRY